MVLCVWASFIQQGHTYLSSLNCYTGVWIMLDHVVLDTWLYFTSCRDYAVNLESIITLNYITCYFCKQKTYNDDDLLCKVISFAV